MKIFKDACEKQIFHSMIKTKTALVFAMDLMLVWKPQ